MNQAARATPTKACSLLTAALLLVALMAGMQAAESPSAEPVHPALGGLDDRIAEAVREAAIVPVILVEEEKPLKGILADAQRLSQELAEVRAQTDNGARVDAVDALGRRLRQTMASLPLIRSEQQTGQIQLRAKIAELQEKLLKFDLWRHEVYDVDQALNDVLKTLDPTLDPTRREAIAVEARRMIIDLREQLSALVQELKDAIGRLEEVAEARQRLIDVTAQYQAFIDEMILWTRSNDRVPLEQADRRDIGWAARWLTDRESWRQLLLTIRTDAREARVPAFSALAAYVLLLLVQPWVRRQLRLVAAIVPGSFGERFTHTVSGLLLTLCVAGIGSILLLVVGWRLIEASSSGEFEKAVGTGLVRAAWIWMTMEFLRQLCKRSGLGEKHFRWNPQATLLMRRNLLWLKFLALPCAFVVWTMEVQGSQAHRESLGRAAFIAGMFALAAFIHRVLHPRQALVAPMLARKPGGWMDRLTVLWFPAALFTPLVLALLAAGGFYYTALRLEQRLQITLLFVLVLMLIGELVVRWLTLARRRLASEQFRRREQAAPALAAGGPAESQQPAVIEDPPVDLWAISEQARLLLKSLSFFIGLLGIWLIWAGVLPALEALDHVALWTNESDFTSVRDLLLAIVLTALALLAGKNIPGLLEITILQRLPISAAGRYAIATIVRYVVVIVGLVAAFTTLGVSWNKVQWIAAAITVGLGFGLQEIIANFVSGLIILFEQPIRVGDTISVGNMTGTVARIRIRATTLVDADRRELIIPNKEFVTGQIVNWTLSDTTMRVRISLRVPYGTDPAMVRSLLLEKARSHPLVLRDPEPLAILTSLGESAMEFELRVFIGHPDHQLRVTNELLESVNQALRAQGVDIAYPHREIVMRMAGPGKPDASAADPRP